LETQVLEELTKTILRDFLDEILVFEIATCPKSGYDVLTDISEKFNHRLSSGTVYSKLYCLERDGIIKCIKKQRKRIFELTDYGKRILNIMENSAEFANIVFKALNITPPQKLSVSQLKTCMRNCPLIHENFAQKLI